MKVFLAKDFSFPGVDIYKFQHECTTSGFPVLLQSERFSNAHINCTNCERSCALLKEKYQPNSCEIEDAKLEFSIFLNTATTTFSVRIDGDVLKVLSNLFGLHERPWVVVQLDGWMDGILGRQQFLQLSSNKIPLESGKPFCEGKMNRPTDWINFFKTRTSFCNFMGTFSVLFGIDNMIHPKVPLRTPENINLLALNTCILEKQIATDLVLISENGAKFPCHRSFLTAHSITFEAMLKGQTFVEGKTGEIMLDDMTKGGVKAFLKYLYCRDTKEPSENPSIAIELLACGNKYGIDILVHSLREIFLNKPTDWFDLSTAMRLFYYGCQVESQSEFKRKALQVLRLKSLPEIENSSDYKELFSENPEAAKELCMALLTHLTLNK